MAACGSTPTAPPTPAPGTPAPVAGASPAQAVVVVSRPVVEHAAVRRVIAEGLLNPRGFLRRSDGSLLVGEAGRGDPDDPLTGRLVRLVDGNGDGDFDDDGEREIVLAKQPSVNILGRLAMNRDEVFGFADIAEGDGMVLATLADPLRGSTVFRIDVDPPMMWSRTLDNANSITFHPGTRAWFAVQSFANTLIRIGAEGHERLVTRFAPLEDGQDAVPAAVVVDPSDGALLVALFSGQRGGDVGGSGVDFVKYAGRVVRVDPETGTTRDVVRGLNAPTDLAVSGRSLHVLEFCSGFLDPVRTRREAVAGSSHGGFERFSGRLLRIDRPSARVASLAEGLDLPTNLEVLADGRVLVAEGQGTPGRPIPGPGGIRTLDGRLVEVVPGDPRPAN